MDRHGYGRRIRMLWALVVLGIAYSSLLHYAGTLTGANNVDGIIGVLLGLYICSHPAANVVDILFFRRAVRPRFLSRRAFALWWALNGAVLLIGWIVIFVGTTRLVGRAEAVLLLA